MFKRLLCSAVRAKFEKFSAALFEISLGAFWKLLNIFTTNRVTYFHTRLVTYHPKTLSVELFVVKIFTGCFFISLCFFENALHCSFQCWSDRGFELGVQILRIIWVSIHLALGRMNVYSSFAALLILQLRVSCWYSNNERFLENSASTCLNYHQKTETQTPAKKLDYSNRKFVIAILPVNYSISKAARLK